MTKSLKEAARALGVSEESLRRKILLGEVVATPVADDRQYLVTVGTTSPRPCCPRFRLVLWCVAAWAALGIGLAVGTSRIGETCVRCGSWKATELLFGVPMNSVAVEGVGRDCPHDWRRDGRK